MLNIAYATDRGYMIPTFVSAASALYWADKSRADVIINILDVGIPDSDWTKFETRLRALFGQEFGLVRHRVDETVFKGFKQWHNSIAAYARLLLPDILPSENWCIYCDGDTLFTGNPMKLLEVFDERYALIGHRDNDSRIQERWFADHGYKFNPDEYICSGFLVLNLDLFRRVSLGPKCLEFIKKNEDVIYPDQDALNIVCHDRILQLRDKWGEFGYKYGDILTQGCIHYGSRQPWNLKFMRNRGMLDIEYLWFRFANVVCKLPLREALLGRPRIRFFYLRFIALIFKYINILSSKIPCLSSRTRIAMEQMICEVDIDKFLSRTV